jgi:hypothetical protein
MPILSGLPVKAGGVVEEAAVGWPDVAAGEAADEVGAEVPGEAEVAPAEAEVAPAEAEVAPAEGEDEPEEQAVRTAAVRTARTLIRRRSAIPASDVAASR